MPRIYTSCNDPLDFCRFCFPSLPEAKEVYGDVNKTGEGPDGRGNCFEHDAAHPDYEHNGYRCVECSRYLSVVDEYKE